MTFDRRFQDAIERIDQANAEDPRVDIVDGLRVSRELRFATCVYEWVEKLLDRPSEELLLAARAHTLRRWEIPRDRYALDNLGYHEWREACAKHHAAVARAILEDSGYSPEGIEPVEAFILRTRSAGDRDAQILEDADCLAFLELKLESYLDAWDEGKALRILRGTYRKMSPQARKRIPALALSGRAVALLRKLPEP